MITHKKIKAIIAVFLLSVMVLASAVSTQALEEVQAEQLTDVTNAVLSYQPTFPLAEYPDGSYFTNNGKACTTHTGCKYDGSCNCKSYDISIQCMGFAKYASDQYAHRSSFSFVPGDTDTSYRSISDPEDAKKEIQKLRVGAYIRVDDRHSIVIAAISDTGFTIYDGNYTGLCQVSYRTVTYKKFAGTYNAITKSMSHSFSKISKYNSSYHKVACSSSGCTGYIYQPHYALTPGTNVKCLGCGYIGNISSGLQSVGNDYTTTIDYDLLYADTSI